MKQLLTLVFLLIFVIPSHDVKSQVSVNVNTLDPIYRDVDKLVAHGLVKKIIVGQKPYSRREFARITAEASRNFSELEDQLQNRSAYIRPILKRLQRRFKEELVQLGAEAGETSWYSLHLLDELEFDATMADSRPRGIEDNGLGALDAQINPLLQNRQGRDLIDGVNISLETTHWVRLTDHLAFYLRPRFQVAETKKRGIDDDTEATIHQLYGKLFFKNFEILAGRDEVFWGQGKHSGLLLSNNPRPLDLVKLSNDLPFHWPWVFRVLGPQKLTFFYSDLGPDQFFPNSYLVGYKWSMQPFSFFEFGASNLVISGGEGSPDGSFGDRLKDVFPVEQFFSGNQLQIDNKIGGFDARFRIPQARNLELYFEAIFEDTFGDFKKGIWDDAGYILGIYMPRLTDSGTVDLRLEAHRTGIRFYRHPQFRSGLSLNQNVLGNFLGPDAIGIYVNINWDMRPDHRLGFLGAFEERREDQYGTAGGSVLKFVRTENRPDEKRIRFLVDYFHRFKDLPINLYAEVGYEYVDNFAFVADNNEHHFLGRIQFQVNLDELTKFPR